MWTTGGVLQPEASQDAGRDELRHGELRKCGWGWEEGVSAGAVVSTCVAWHDYCGRQGLTLVYVLW